MSCTRRLPVALMMVGLAAGPAVVARSAVIAWGPASDTSSFNDIISAGFLVSAVNEGNDALTVDPGGLNIPFSTANDLPNGIFGGAAPGVNTGDANFNTILNSASWSAPDPATLTLAGLTAGNDYQVQLFYTDTRACCNTRTQTYTAGNTSAPISASGSGNGQFMVGDFTADGPTQAIDLSSSATDPTLNAYVVRQTSGPPPPPVVTPAFAYGTTPDYGSPTLLINGAGLLGSGPDVFRPHQTIHTQGWLIQSLDPANELVFGMDGTADLDGMYVWQYSQGTCCTGRGVSTFDIQFSTDGGGTYSAPVSLGPLNAASGTSDETAQLISFAAQTGVTHVKITNMADFPALSNPGWQGLNEVRFQGSLSPLPPAPPEPGHFGNTVSFRAQASDGSDQVLWSNMYGAPVAGSVDSVEVFFQGGTQPFELFQLRPTGTANQYDVIASSGAITPDASGSMTLPNGPFDLQKGDLLFHYGRGIPYTDSLTTEAAHNNQRLYYPTPSGPAVGGPVTLGAGGFPLHSSLYRDYAWTVELDGFVETVGNGAGPGLTQPDTASSILVVMDNDPFTQPGQLDTWQFFNDTANTGGRLITPVLLRDTAGTVEVMGIGATRVGTENGFQQYDFELVEGTDVVAPGDLFGFYYGDDVGGNQGSVEYTQTGAMNIRLFTENLGDGLQMTDVFQNPTYQLPRYYSINASTVSAAAVPEPSTLVLAALGLMGLGFYGRRRRRS